MRIRPLDEILREFPEFAAKRGWEPGKENRVYVHSRLGEAVAVVICKDDGTPIYDQILHNEPTGGVTIPINKKGEIGLITVERPLFKSHEIAEFPLCDFSKLGVVSIEVPRGFPFKGEKSQTAAARECGEEINSPVLESRRIGYVHANSTYHPAPIPIFLAKVDEDFTGLIPPDVNERILKVSYHSVEEVKTMIRDGKIICGFTKAAICHYFCL